MSSNGGIGPLPFRLVDFLQSSYYAISIVAIMLALVGFIFSLKWRIEDLEAREREHPTRHELAQVAVKVDDRIGSLETRMQEFTRRLDDMQEYDNKIHGELPVIIERQNVNSAAIKELQQRIWSSGGGRGPTAPKFPP